MGSTKILWASQHHPLAEQQRFLEGVFGNVELVLFTGRIPDYTVVVEEKERHQCQEIVLVAPDKVIVGLTEHGYKPLKSHGRSTNGGSGYEFDKFVRVTQAAFKTRDLNPKRFWQKRGNVLWFMKAPAREKQLDRLFRLLGPDSTVLYEGDTKMPLWELEELVALEEVDILVVRKPLWWIAEMKSRLPEKVRFWKQAVRQSRGNIIDFFTRRGKPMRYIGFEEVTNACWEIEDL